ncbi:MAG TPA: DUF1700 domain-containing protein [Thermoanaerobaculia bacterium]|nr:DUF1700 domain-containing protein [Thermoanaerobaculia bacterium]
MMQSEKLQRKIDSYLAELRKCLGELPPEEVHDILQEIRGHILERAEASGELTEERLVAILKALGRPEEIAPLYQVDSIVAKARASFSPRVVLRAIHRWSHISSWGFALFVIGVIGYALAFSLALSGLGKIVAPQEVGAWLSPGGFNIGTTSNPAARDVLGWWLVPVGLVGGAITAVATTQLLRWTLRFARFRRPTGGTAAC